MYVEESSSENPYGLEPEIAWNTGFSAAREFILGIREGTVKLDYYYTWFKNQVVVDYDTDPQSVIFSNLDGVSFSHSLQAQLDYELFTRYDIRLAYRFNDVRSTISGELLPEILIPKHRAFVNMAYETMDQWKFDMTFNWQGMKRIPNTASNPQEFQRETFSPDFFLWNAQVSKSFGERLELYLGAENILNYRQQDPIIDPQNPFGDYFDASLVWGPIFGRKVYGGLRYRID
jgi:outer membrane receptor protein involved in Fe transport